MAPLLGLGLGKVFLCDWRVREPTAAAWQGWGGRQSGMYVCMYVWTLRANFVRRR